MRPWLTIVMFAACGGNDETPVTDASPVDVNPPQCEALPAMGQFARRQGNPRLSAGATFTDGLIDTTITDPDVSFDAAANRFDLYYSAEHATAFGQVGNQVIRHATSPDRMTWTVDDAPVLEASADGAAWDRATTEAPSVVIDPAASADRRYLMVYAGSSAQFPNHPFPASSIGAAFSADGVTFTRVSAADSPHGEAGLVLTAADVYAGVGTGTKDGIVDDPELVLVDGVYHLFFTSFTCDGSGCANVIASGVAHATSTDGIHWVVAQAPVKSLLRASADDTTGGRAPSAIYDAVHCRWELWQTSDLPGDVAAQPVVLDNAAGVWHADSSDGIQWSVSFIGQRDVTWNQTSPAAGEALGLRAGADVAQVSSGRVMLMVGYDDQNVPAGSVLPTTAGTRAGVMTMNVITRDVP